MITHQVCPVCKSGNHKLSFQAKDYTVTKEIFNVQHCSDCGFRFTSPVPDQQSIGKYYQSEDYISHSNTSKGFINRIYQMVRNYTLKTKRNLVKRFSGKQTGRLLDIGAGAGDFLNQMKMAGWDCRGLEPDDSARQLIESRFGIRVDSSEKLFEIEAESTDVVTMWHVLEHVHQLDEYLDKIYELLKPNGKFIVAVPNYHSYDAEHYREGWAAYDVPRHLYHFHEPSMKHLVERHGFRLTGIRKMPFDSFYVSMLSEKYRAGSMISGIWNGFCSWCVALTRSERCSSIIYLIEKPAS